MIPGYWALGERQQKPRKTAQEEFDYLLTYVDEKMPGYSTDVVGWFPVLVRKEFNNKLEPIIWSLWSLGERGTTWRYPTGCLYIFKYVRDATAFKLVWG